MVQKKSIKSVVVREKKYAPPKDFQRKAHIKSLGEYRRFYKYSVEDPEGFLGREGSAAYLVQKMETGP